MKWGGKSYGRCLPEPVTPEEHSALRAELVSLLVLLFAAGVCMFGEQLLDLLGIGVR
jgi:hypothetical protein